MAGIDKNRQNGSYNKFDAGEPAENLLYSIITPSAKKFSQIFANKK